MKIKDIVTPLEEFAPLEWQEGFDNSGLVVGRPDDETGSALICVDATQEVLDEAEKLGARLVISHHPIIFHPLKRLNGNGYVEQVVERAIRTGTALYACHTNLDSAPGGMSWRLAEMLGIENPRFLEEEVAVQNGSAIYHSPPRLSHGFGVIGTLAEAVEPLEFLRSVQRRLGVKAIRYSEIPAQKISRIAICSGSGAALIHVAKEAGAELFIAADFKYNDFFAGESGGIGSSTGVGAGNTQNPFIVADMGHFESEFCVIDLIYDVISKKIANFALHKSKNSRNPVGYLI